MKRTFLFLILMCLTILASAQGDAIKIIPLSPNAATITKFGEIPVSNFTGVPNIGIPLYTIKSGELTLPLELSYHAGGNKVETLSSWAGMAWNVGNIPSITRSVNGQPDEGGYGFFYKIGGKTVKQRFTSFENGNETDLTELAQLVKDYNADSEPDIFNYSLNGKSGKFFYNQELEKFVTIPHADIKIEDSNGFIITDDDGTKYWFGEKENSATIHSGPSAAVTSAWMVSQIVSASKSDTISFEYATETQYSRTTFANTRYYIISTNCNGSMPTDAIGSAAVSIVSKLPSYINFKGGRVQFIRNSSQREDLQGGYALNKIKVLNNTGTTIKEFELVQKYVTSSGLGAGCVIGDTYSKKWMLLDSLKENMIGSSKSLSHKFEYDELNFPACRTSPAQDFWGYHNGQTSNLDLIPTSSNPYNNNSLITGADRYVNPAYSQFGILKKIKYPTGGFTTFEYENNKSSSADLPSRFTIETAYIGQDGPVEGELPEVNTFDTTFVINNLPDPDLNFNHPDGGAC